MKTPVTALRWSRANLQAADAFDVCPTIPLPASHVRWPRFSCSEVMRALQAANIHTTTPVFRPYVDSYGGPTPILKPLRAALARRANVPLGEVLGGIVHPLRLAYAVLGMTQHDVMRDVLQPLLVPLLAPLFDSPRDNDFMAGYFLSQCVLEAYPRDLIIHAELRQFTDIEQKVSEKFASTPSDFCAQRLAKSGVIAIPLLRVA